MNYLERYLKLTIEKEETLRRHCDNKIERSLPLWDQLMTAKARSEEIMAIHKEIEELEELLKPIIGEELELMETYYYMYHFFNGYSHEQSMAFLKQGYEYYAGEPIRKTKRYKTAKRRAEQLNQATR